MIGHSLSHYQILEKLGEGGMGVVYRAHDSRLERDVALKVLPSAALTDNAARRRFRQEALALSKLSHPNIAVVHDFDSQEGADFIVMELLPGSTLAAAIAARPLSEKDVLTFGQQIASALAEAHDHGVIHRDLKPSNVMITPKGQAKVLDFGLARVVPPVPDEAITASLSQPGHAAGTLPYMAPEQLRGELAEARTDVHALGCILFEMATGQRPFAGKTSTALAGDILHKPPATPRRLNPALSPELERIILKCLEKDPENRYQSAKELAVDLRRLALSGTATLPAVTAAPSKLLATRYAYAAVAVAVVLALLFAADIGGLRRLVGRYAAAPVIQSLAVLPLNNLSTDPGQEYFADALTEEMTNELASIRALRVISRTSASRYRNTSRPLREIAAELDVDALVEGSVTRSTDQVRVTVQLIDGSTDRHLWSKSYVRPAGDVIGLQQEIARAIAQEIHAVLTPDEQQRFATPETRNPQAYEAYLRAAYKLETALQNRDDVEAAIQLAGQATVLDPDFADAHVALARAHIAKIFGWQGGREDDEQAFVALSKALVLNPNLAEAYAIRGSLFYTRLRQFDIARAVSNYRKAASLNPNLALAHANLGSELTHTGLHDEAIEEFRAALRLDPHHAGSKVRLGRALLQAGRVEQALVHYERNNVLNFEKAFALALLSRNREAWETVRALESGLTTAFHRGGGANLEDVEAVRAFLHAREGKPSRAIAAIREADGLGKNNDHFHHASFIIAAAYAQLGQPREAVHWLKRAAGAGMPNLPLFRDHPCLQSLRGHSEYENFLAELRPRWEQLAAAIR